MFFGGMWQERDGLFSLRIIEDDDDSSQTADQSRLPKNWRPDALLGRGGFSEVRFVVQLENQNNRCAVKIVKKEAFLQLLNERHSQLTVRSEANILRGLRFPGIIRFFG